MHKSGADDADVTMALTESLMPILDALPPASPIHRGAPMTAMLNHQADPLNLEEEAAGNDVSNDEFNYARSLNNVLRGPISYLTMAYSFMAQVVTWCMVIYILLVLATLSFTPGGTPHSARMCRAAHESSINASSSSSQTQNDLFYLVIIIVAIYVIVRIALIIQWLIYWIIFAEMLTYAATSNIHALFWLDDSLTDAEEHARNVILIVLIALEFLTIVVYLLTHFVYPWLVQNHKLNSGRWWTVRPGPQTNTLTYRSLARFYTSKRNVVKYCGGLNAKGEPHGYGMWSDTSFHGERLTGQWENGVPIGPFRSFEHGSGYSFVNIRIGFCHNRGEAKSDGIDFWPSHSSSGIHWGVASVECSVSGGFFTFLPSVSHLTPSGTPDSPQSAADCLPMLRTQTDDVVFSSKAVDKRHARFKKMKSVKRKIFRESSAPLLDTNESVDDKEALILLHGYNCSLDYGLDRLGQLLALGDFPPHIHPFVFSWPSGGVLAYFQAKKVGSESERTGNDFQAFLRSLSDVGYTKLNIIAHSMGARVFFNCLNRGQLDEVLMFSFDIFRPLDLREQPVNSSRHFGPAKLMLSTLTFCNPDYDRNDFVKYGGGYDRSRRFCDHITLYADGMDGALFYLEFLSKKSLCSPLNYSLGKRGYMIHRDASEHDELQDRSNDTMLGWRETNLTPAVDMDVAIAAVNQNAKFEGVTSFAYNRAPVSRRLEDVHHSIRDRVKSDLDRVGRLQYLDMDVIDTTWMDNNVHAIRHNYFNLNPTIVDDLRHLIVHKKRARSRPGLLQTTSAENVYIFLVAPSHVKNNEARANVRTSDADVAMALTESLMPILDASPLASPTSHDVPMTMMLHHLADGLNVEEAASNHDVSNGELNYARAFSFMTGRRLQRRYRGVYRKVPHTGEWRPQDESTDSLNDVACGDVVHGGLHLAGACDAVVLVWSIPERLHDPLMFVLALDETTIDLSSSSPKTRDDLFYLVIIIVAIYVIVRIALIIQWLIYWIIFAEMLTYAATSNIHALFWLDDSLTDAEEHARNVILIVLIALEFLTIVVYLLTHFVYPWLVQNHKLNSGRWWTVRPGPQTNTLTYRSLARFYTSKRNVVKYCGGLNAKGEPHGYGMWSDTSFHGERLTGQWENGVPIGPFRSFEHGSGYSFVNIRIGFCHNRGEAKSDGIDFWPSHSSSGIHWGVASVECSVSGGFFTFLPSVSHLTPSGTPDSPQSAADCLPMLRTQTDDVVFSSKAVDKRHARFKKMKSVKRKIFRESSAPLLDTNESVDDKEALILLHGYNCSLDYGLDRLGQLLALGDFPPHIHPFVFSWPSGGVLAYFQAKKVGSESERTGNDFQAFLRSLSDVGYTKLNIIAHSMGARVFFNCLNRGQLDEVLMFSFDIFRPLDLREQPVNSSRHFGPAKLMLSTLTFCNPDYDRNDFVKYGGGYDRSRRFCDHITLYADGMDGALFYLEFLSKKSLCSPLNYSLGKRGYMIHRDASEHDELQDRSNDTMLGWRETNLTPAVDMDVAIAAVNQNAKFEGVTSFAYNRAPVSRRLEDVHHSIRDRVKSDLDRVGRLQYLDMDVIDTTWMDNNVHAIRHNYFNLNPTIVDDLRHLIVHKKRARSRPGLLQTTSAENVYIFLVAPSHVKNNEARANVRTSDADVAMALTESLMPILDASPLASPTSHDVPMTMMLHHLADGLNVEEAASNHDVSNGELNYARAFSFMTGRRLQRRYRGVYRKVPHTGEWRPQDESTDSLNDVACGDVVHGGLHLAGACDAVVLVWSIPERLHDPLMFVLALDETTIDLSSSSPKTRDDLFYLVIIIVAIYVIVRIALIIQWLIYWIIFAEMLTYAATSNIHALFWLDDSLTDAEEHARNVILIVLIALEFLTIVVYLLTHFVYPWLVQNHKLNSGRWWTVRPGPQTNTLTYRSLARFYTSKRNVVKYCGGLNAKGEPHGYGMWSDTSFHGERLTGQWENGVPIGPFRSFEHGSGYSFVNIRIGFCHNRGEAKSDGIDFWPSHSSSGIHWGVASVECSVSGGFFTFLPSVSHLTPSGTPDSPQSAADCLPMLRTQTDDVVFSSKAVDKRHARFKKMKSVKRKIFRESSAPLLDTNESVDDKEALILLHGYNCSLDYGLDRLGQLLALGDFPPHIHPFVFSWPSGGVLAYFQAKKVGSESERTGNDFQAFLRSLSDVGYTKLNIIAHSMGARVFFNCLNRGQLDEVLMFSFDIFRPLDLREQPVNSSRHFGPAKLMLSTLTFCNPDYDRNDFVKYGGGYDRSRRFCDHITLYADGMDGALLYAELLSKKSLCSPLNYSLGKRGYMIHRDASEHDELQDRSNDTMLGWRETNLTPAVDMDVAIAAVNQNAKFEGVTSFAYNRAPVSRRLEDVHHSIRDRVKSDLDRVGRLQYLDMDVIDTTWMDNNVHAIRHNYFNLNPTIVDDLRHLIVHKKRARSRPGLLQTTSAENVYIFLVAPSYVKNK
ncbi:hypothetical protein FI667_g10981, partial [Globisporangium splendens]